MKAAAALLLIAALASGAAVAQTPPPAAEAPERVQTAYASPAVTPAAGERANPADVGRDGGAAGELADLSVVPLLLLGLAAIGVGVYRRTQFQD